jgi:hypothetical protein
MTDDWALFIAALIPFMPKSYQKEGSSTAANSTNAAKKCIENLLRPMLLWWPRIGNGRESTPVSVPRIIGLFSFKLAARKFMIDIKEAF